MPTQSIIAVRNNDRIIDVRLTTLVVADGLYASGRLHQLTGRFGVKLHSFANDTQLGKPSIYLSRTLTQPSEIWQQP